jgi:hypothetical protein
LILIDRLPPTATARHGLLRRTTTLLVVVRINGGPGARHERRRPLRRSGFLDSLVNNGRRLVDNEKVSHASDAPRPERLAPPETWWRGPTARGTPPGLDEKDLQHELRLQR